MLTNLLPHFAGTGVGVVGLIILALLWRTIRFVLKVVLFLVIVVLAVGAWAFFEFQQTGHWPFEAWRP